MSDEYEYYESNDSDDDIPLPPDSSPEWVWDDDAASWVWEGTEDETGDEFEDFSEDFDDTDADDEDYEAEDDEPDYGESVYEESRDASDDGAAPDWWEDGMPSDWWDYYGDDYEIEEFEIAIDY